MIKKLALFFMLLTVPAFSQGVGRGGVPGGPTTQAGAAILPGSPNAVYTFIANGDQTGTTVHDTSGSGNNSTLGATAPVWNGLGIDISQNTSANMNLPAALNTDLSFCIAYYAPAFVQTGTQPPGFDTLIGNTGNASNGMTAWILNNTQLSVNGPAGQTISQLGQQSGFHTYCIVLGLSGNSTNDAGYIDGLAVANTNSGREGTLIAGNYTLGTNYAGYGQGQIYYFASWAAQLTAAQVQRAALAINAAVIARGVATVPVITPIATQYFISVGDSITNGNGLTAGLDFVSQASIPAFTKTNLGTTGSNTWWMLAQEPLQIAPYCKVQGGVTIAHIYGGTNDPGLGYTAQSTYYRLAQWAAEAKSQGCIPVVGTMISRTTEDTFKDQLNPLIRGGAQLGLFGLTDFASDPHMGCDGCNTNATYFQVDDVHPTAAGQVLLAAIVNNTVNSLTGASAAAPTAYASNAVTMVSADNFVNQTCTAACTATLPDCLGVTGSKYQIFNTSAGAFTITFSGKASEAITGSATLAQNLAGIFQAQLISQAAAGCGWQRIQ